jgi:hypothetical protein
MVTGTGRDLVTTHNPWKGPHVSKQVFPGIRIVQKKLIPERYKARGLSGVR